MCLEILHENMSALIRDSAFGQIVRLLSRKRLFRYPEEVDSSSWQKYINVEKTLRVARTGSTNQPSGQEKADVSNGGQSTPESSDNQDSGDLQLTTTISKAPVDPEKGRNVDVCANFARNS